jgi:HTH-type transcriptional regulator/antitoxin HipB
MREPDMIDLFAERMECGMQLIITNPSQVSEILRGRRKARRMPQQQLAAKLGISQSRLSAIEAGSAALTLDRLITLANVLGLQLVLQDKADKLDKLGPKADW